MSRLWRVVDFLVAGAFVLVAQIAYAVVVGVADSRLWLVGLMALTSCSVWLAARWFR